MPHIPEMDTRRKILSCEEALDAARAAREAGASITLVSGYFDVLQPSSVRGLESHPGTRFFALVLDPPAALLNAQARLELAAALQVIDYVINCTSQPANLIASLAPDRLIRAEEDHLATRERLIRRVIEGHGQGHGEGHGERLGQAAPAARRQSH
jgi:hypothetical protein